MRAPVIITLFILLTLSAAGQNERKFIRSGNKLFMEAVRDTTSIDTVRFSNAEMEYRKALEKKPEDLQWNYNLADALYKQQKFEDAGGKFEELAEKMEHPVEKARALHNLGNTQLMQQKIDESIESYKKALRRNPSDLETKYNLAYAQMLKKKQEQQQQQQQNQDQNQNQDQDQNKDQNKENQQDQNKDQQDQQNKNQQNNQNKDQQNKDQQKQPPQQNKISRQDAEQLLQALQNDERDIQDKVKKAKAAKAKRTKVEKEW